jgi:hypothetical protein
MMTPMGATSSLTRASVALPLASTASTSQALT